MTQEIRETFVALPFHLSSDSDSESPTSVESVSSDSGGSGGTPQTPPGPPKRIATIPKSLRGD